MLETSLRAEKDLFTSKLISDFVVLYNYTITIYSFSKLHYYQETNDMWGFSCAKTTLTATHSKLFIMQESCLMIQCAKVTYAKEFVDTSDQSFIM